MTGAYTWCPRCGRKYMLADPDYLPRCARCRVETVREPPPADQPPPKPEPNLCGDKAYYHHTAES